MQDLETFSGGFLRRGEWIGFWFGEPAIKIKRRSCGDGAQSQELGANKLVTVLTVRSSKKNTITDLAIVPSHVGVGKNLGKNWTKSEGAVICDTIGGELEVLAYGYCQIWTLVRSRQSKKLCDLKRSLTGCTFVVRKDRIASDRFDLGNSLLQNL